MRTVYGIDYEPHQLDLARLNVSMNGVTNVEFKEGCAEELGRRFWLQEAAPEMIVVDPP